MGLVAGARDERTRGAWNVCSTGACVCPTPAPAATCAPVAVQRATQAGQSCLSQLRRQSRVGEARCSGAEEGPPAQLQQVEAAGRD